MSTSEFHQTKLTANTVKHADIYDQRFVHKLSPHSLESQSWHQGQNGYAIELSGSRFPCQVLVGEHGGSTQALPYKRKFWIHAGRAAFAGEWIGGPARRVGLPWLAGP